MSKNKEKARLLQEEPDDEQEDEITGSKSGYQLRIHVIEARELKGRHELRPISHPVTIVIEMPLGKVIL